MFVIKRICMSKEALTWWFMILMVLMVPLMFLGFGHLFRKRAPKNINFAFGYRTKRSMMNQDTWIFAHQYIGKMWSVLGIIVLPLSIIPMLFVIGKSEDTVGIVGGIVEGIQILVLICSIIPTEIALRKKFDEYGRRKK